MSAACLALFLALPVAADDTDWKAGGAATARNIEQDRDVATWSLALIGPAAMIFFVTALGLTITVRSLRSDFRRQRSLNHYWRHGAMARARLSPAPGVSPSTSRMTASAQAVSDI